MHIRFRVQGRSAAPRPPPPGSPPPASIPAEHAISCKVGHILGLGFRAAAQRRGHHHQVVHIQPQHLPRVGPQASRDRVWVQGLGFMLSFRWGSRMRLDLHAWPRMRHMHLVLECHPLAYPGRTLLHAEAASALPLTSSSRRALRTWLSAESIRRTCETASCSLCCNLVCC